MKTPIKFSANCLNHSPTIANILLSNSHPLSARGMREQEGENVVMCEMKITTRVPPGLPFFSIISFSNKEAQVWIATSRAVLAVVWDDRDIIGFVGKFVWVLRWLSRERMASRGWYTWRRHAHKIQVGRVCLRWAEGNRCGQCGGDLPPN